MTTVNEWAAEQTEKYGLCWFRPIPQGIGDDGWSVGDGSAHIAVVGLTWEDACTHADKLNDQLMGGHRETYRP
jgi:hypothetical protein